MYSGEIIYIFYVQELTGNFEYIQNDQTSIGNKAKGANFEYLQRPIVSYL